MSKHDYFDKQVKQKLDGHEAPVPADAWANIQKGRRRRRPLAFIWLFALLLLGDSAALYHYQNKSSAEIKTKTTAQNQLPSAEKASDEKKNRLAPSTIVNDITVPSADEKNKSSVQKDVADISVTTNKDVSSTSNTNNFGNKAATADVKTNSTAGKLKTTDKKSKLIAQQNKTTPAIIIKEDNYEDKLIAANREIKTDGKTTMKVQAPGVEDETSSEDDTVTSKTVDELKDFVVADSKQHTDTIALSVVEKKADSVLLSSTNNITVNKKKKFKSSLTLDVSFSAFTPFGKAATINSINRSTTTALNRAEFKAHKVDIRLQPSTSFSLQLFKSLSAKTAVGAGLGYALVKEYVSLNGEETNTNLSVIKRLENGNALVDDTVTTVTKGIRNIDAVNSYTFLSIPLSIRYQIMQHNKWTMDVHGGIDINLVSKYRNSIGGQLIPQFAAVNNQQRNQSIGTGFNAGLLLRRQLGKKYWLYAAPYLQLNPKKLYVDEMLSPRNLHRAGIGFGISYGL